jgi:hypothetical protein
MCTISNPILSALVFVDPASARAGPNKRLENKIIAIVKRMNGPSDECRDVLTRCFPNVITDFGNRPANSRTGEWVAPARPEVMILAMTQATFPLHMPLHGRNLAAYAAMGLFLGLVGPFGSYLNNGPAMRIAYWTATSLISCVAFDILHGLARERFARLPQWVLLPLVLLLANIFLAFLTRGLAILLWPFLAKIGWLEWYLQSLLVSLIYAFTFGARKFRSVALAVIPNPPHLGKGVLCLQMEDHYVRIHTLTGSRLILSSLGHAMTGLQGGMQVHRSWWVSRDAVEMVIEDGRNIRLKLHNGVEAPVARTKIARLREAGWLP